MSELASVPLAEMQPLLQGVSRSFYITIRLLPAALRRPVAVAYLLARATDTVADTASLPAAQRQRQLTALGAAIQGDATAPGALDQIGEAFVGAQADPAERRLMATLPRCLAWLAALDPSDQQEVRSVLQHITRGQSLDLARFGDGSATQALQNAGELHEYTYLVAGCVGEFWTRLCVRHVPDFAKLPAARMQELGRDYGAGLQLVNILRDLGEDLAQGRCYLPADELAAAGLSAADALADPTRLAPVWARWHGLAVRGMESGLGYAHALNSRRIRAASALPALLGARTLALLESAGPGAPGRVKVPRREVYAVLARLALTLGGRAMLAAQFQRLQGSGAQRWDNRAP